MGRLFVVVVQWLLRHAWLLVLVMAVLLAGRWMLAGREALERARADHAAVQRNQSALQAEPVRTVGWFESLLPAGPGVQAPAASAAAAFEGLAQRSAAERERRQRERSGWQASHAVAVRFPGSEAFLAVARLDVEIGVLQKAERHFRAQAQLLRSLGDIDKARRSVLAGRDSARTAIAANLAQRRTLWDTHPFLRSLPGTWVARALDRLDAERRARDAQLAGHEASLQLLANSEKLAQEARRTFRLTQADVHEALAPRLREIERSTGTLAGAIDTSAWRRITEDVESVFLPALLILLSAVLSGPLLKAFAFFVIAPFAARRAPIRLLPGADGTLRTAAADPQSGKVSAGSLSVALASGEELRVHADYLQSRPVTTRTSTLTFLDRSHPITSIAAGMALLQRVLPDTGLSVKLSSTRQDLLELARLELPAGAALVLRARGLVGVVHAVDRPVRITSHWRFASLQAWLDLQFRYLVFHGPGSLVVRGARGVVVESAARGRVVNQAGVLGWSAGIARSTARADSFAAYLLGTQDLYNDRFDGDGWFVYEEMPGAGASHSPWFGKGLKGLADSLLKVFGI